MDFDPPPEPDGASPRSLPPLDLSARAPLHRDASYSTLADPFLADESSPDSPDVATSFGDPSFSAALYHPLSDESVTFAEPEAPVVLSEASLAQHTNYPKARSRVAFEVVDSQAESRPGSEFDAKEGDAASSVTELDTDTTKGFETQDAEAQGAEAFELRAQNLVQEHHTGSFAFMRQRKNAGFTSGAGDAASEGEEEEESKERDVGEEVKHKSGGIRGFFSSLSSLAPPRAPPPLDLPAAAKSSSGNSGILAALIALQTQRDGGRAQSVESAESKADSTWDGGYDSDEEKIEQLRFTLAQRRKRRATQKQWEKAVAERPAVVKHTDPQHRRGESVGKRSPLVPLHVSRSTGHLPLDSAPLSAPAVLRNDKSIFEKTASNVKRLGHAVGVDVETTRSRPEAAKSGGGVFGGLIMSTANIAGAAAPTASKLAPRPATPGFQLSRYSAPPESILKRPTIGRAKSYQDEEPRGRTPNRHSFEVPRSKSIVSTTSSKRSPSPVTTSLPRRTDSPIPNLATRRQKGNAPGFHFSLNNLMSSRTSSPDQSPSREGVGTDFLLGALSPRKITEEELEKREWEKEKKRRRKAAEKRKEEVVYITKHVAAILARQEFLQKMCRCFMAFGAPSHRLEGQIQATARVLELNVEVVYLPGILFMSFGDSSTHTSEIKFIKQSSDLALTNLMDSYYIYWRVLHDKVSVTDATLELDVLLQMAPKYKDWQRILMGAICTAALAPSAFHGSTIDTLVCIPMGAILMLAQVYLGRHNLYAAIFEISVAALNSFIAAALASTGQFCFAAVASSSVVLILPGFMVLSGALELANRCMVAGSVRLVYALMFALMLGFGLAAGGEVYERITGLAISGAQDYTCGDLRTNAPWWRATIPKLAYMVTVPTFAILYAAMMGQRMRRKETLYMMIIACSGYVANFFAGRAFPTRPDLSSALAAFCVGIMGNTYGKLFVGSPFVIMVLAVMLMVPSGLRNGGLLHFASIDEANYSAGFSAAESIIQIAIGLTVGLFVATAIVNIVGGGRRRGANLSSF